MTQSDFSYDVILSRWRPWRHFTQKGAAIWWVHKQRLPVAYAAASARSWSVVHSYLLHTLQQQNPGTLYYNKIKTLHYGHCSLCTWRLEGLMLPIDLHYNTGEKSTVGEKFVSWHVIGIGLIIELKLTKTDCCFFFGCLERASKRNYGHYFGRIFFSEFHVGKFQAWFYRLDRLLYCE